MREELLYTEREKIGSGSVSIQKSFFYHKAWEMSVFKKSNLTSTWCRIRLSLYQGFVSFLPGSVSKFGPNPCNFFKILDPNSYKFIRIQNTTSDDPFLSLLNCCASLHSTRSLSYISRLVDEMNT